MMFAKKWKKMLILIVSATMPLASYADRRIDRNPAPPAQPTTGPGSSNYPHASFTQLKLGTGGYAYFLFQPADPKPASAPVVVFLHGFGVTRAQSYVGWITHLVRKGNSVIYPVYQVDTQPPASVYVENAIVAVRNGLNALSSRDHTRPQLDHVTYIGHSIGGVMASIIAARAVNEKLPVPAALLIAHATDPGEGRFGAFDSLLDAADLSQIAPETLLLAVVGADDRVTFDDASHLILDATVQVPAANKEILSIRSDRHGSPPLQATHDAPSSWTPSNALDFFGYWKWADALMSCAFSGEDCEYCLGNTDEQTFMGLWDDGVPVIPAEVIAP